MNSLLGDFGVLVFGIGATLLFLTGYLFTIREFNNQKARKNPGRDAHLRSSEVDVTKEEEK